MADEGFKRKLTAILSADVAGYSRLMAEDETFTVKTIATYREVIASLIKQHRGRVVDSPGDNVLAEFSSVVDAVQCAVAVQQEIQTRNAELPDNRRMEFRIGVNLGDVIDEEDRIYGDGVNIAARLEALADPGGICVSKTAFDQIENKLPLGYEYLGEQSVKNIPKPVGAYRVLMKPEAVGKVIGEKRFLGRYSRRTAMAAIVILLVVAAGLVSWNIYLQHSKKIEPASVEKMAYPLPDKPSIAVLPFDNMSEDPKQEYFSDGLTDQIISGLSKIPNIFVIARNSTFTYKGKPVKVQKVAEDLGVRYVMEGSVQRTADRIRITTQLIDAINGHHVWSGRYDREPKDIFAIQDDITVKIIKAMRIELEGESARQWAEKMPDNLEILEKMLQARKLAYGYGKADLARAQQLFEEVIALDSEYAAAYAGLGYCHLVAVMFGWSESPAKSIETAFKYTQKALALDDKLDNGHYTLALLYLRTSQYEKALAEAERAVALNPNGAQARGVLAGIVGRLGRWKESVALAEKSIRLNPFPYPIHYVTLGRAYFMTEQYDEAIITFKKALNVNPNYLDAHAFLAACYSSLGRQAEAEDAAAEVLRIYPQFNLESYAKTQYYKHKTDMQREIAALQKAGLPE